MFDFLQIQSILSSGYTNPNKANEFNTATNTIMDFGLEKQTPVSQNYTLDYEQYYSDEYQALEQAKQEAEEKNEKSDKPTVQTPTKNSSMSQECIDKTIDYYKSNQLQGGYYSEYKMDDEIKRVAVKINNELSTYPWSYTTQLFGLQGNEQNYEYVRKMLIEANPSLANSGFEYSIPLNKLENKTLNLPNYDDIKKLRDESKNDTNAYNFYDSYLATFKTKTGYDENAMQEEIEKSPTPTETPSEAPSEIATETPSEAPIETPSEAPSEIATETPSEAPIETPSEKPTASYIFSIFSATAKVEELTQESTPAPSETLAQIESHLDDFPHLELKESIELGKNSEVKECVVPENTQINLGGKNYNISYLLENMPQGIYTIGGEEGSEKNIKLDGNADLDQHIEIIKTSQGNYLVRDLGSEDSVKLSSLDEKDYRLKITLGGNQEAKTLIRPVFDAVDSIAQQRSYIGEDKNYTASYDENYMNDLTKLYFGLEEGKTIEEIFTPSFSDADSALSKINIGDVCQIENSDLAYIKTAQGELKELGISAQTYLELLPPVKRYETYQGEIGDCFLVSALDLMYKTPELRYELLKSFKELDNGDIQVTIPGNGNYAASVLVFDKSQIEQYASDYSDEYIQKRTNPTGVQKVNLNVYGATGFKMLEDAFGSYFINVRFDDFSKSINNLAAKRKNGTISNNEKMIQQAYEEYVAAIEPYVKGIDGKNIDDADACILGRIVGGRQIVPFEAFGLECGDYNCIIDGKLDLENALNKMAENSDHCVFYAGTKNFCDDNAPYGLTKNHAYSIEPIIENGETKYRITNPHNCSQTTVLTKEQIETYFDGIGYVEI